MNRYSPGDRVRVLVDEPYATSLHQGDIVTVLRMVTVFEGPTVQIPAIEVSTNDGQFLLGLDVVEKFEPDYKPAEPDEVIDGIFERMIRADRELHTIILDADTALGAEEAAVSTQLAQDSDHQPGRSATGWEQPGRDHTYRVTDYAADVLEVHYAEQHCPAHGREAAFFFQVNGEIAVVVPVENVDPLIRFLFNRRNFSRRPEGD